MGLETRVWTASSHGTRERIEAGDMIEAWREAEAWLRDGDWPAEGCAADLHVEEDLRHTYVALVRAVVGPDAELEWHGQGWHVFGAAAHTDALRAALPDIPMRVTVDDDGYVVVYLMLPAPEERSGTIVIEPDEERLDEHHRAHTRTGHEHEWQAPHALVGGIRSHPGVWGGRGSQLLIHEACVCGARRRDDFDPVRPPYEGPRNVVSIEYPDGLWPWGEDCVTPGERADGEPDEEEA